MQESKTIRRAKAEFGPPPPPPPPEDPAQPELPLEGLRKGDVSIAVYTLQQRMGVPASGAYDDWTEYSVKRFQEENGLSVDGVATPRVHQMLGLPWPPVQ